MHISNHTKGLLAVVLFTSLSACGGSGGSDSVLDDTIDAVADDPETVVTPPADDPVAASEEDTEEATTPTDFLFGPPQFLLGECGSVEISTASANNNPDTPTELFVGVPVAGQLDPDSATEDADIWQVTLEPGSYHFVADARGPSDTVFGLLDIRFESLGAETDDEISGSNFGFLFDLRVYEFVEIESTQTLTLSLDTTLANQQIIDYTFGIFANGTEVPSPEVDPSRCQEVNTLSLGTTEAPLVTAGEVSADRNSIVLYAIDLPAGVYQIDATTTVDDGFVAYQIGVLDEFLQDDGRPTLETEDTNPLDTVFSTSDTFEVDGDSQTWISLTNFSSLDAVIEFTVNSL